MPHPLIESLESRLFLSASPAVTKTVAKSSSPAIAAPLVVANTLQTTYDANGIATLTYNGSTLLNTAVNGGDRFRVSEFERVSANGTISYGYDWQNLQKVTMNMATQTVTWSYDWGSVSGQFQQVGSQLNLIITVKNISKTDTIAGLDIVPLSLRFPNALPGPGYPEVGFGIDGPDVQPADFGTGVMALANDDVTKPLYTGLFTYTDTPTSHHYDVWVATMKHSTDISQWPTLSRPVGPGATDQYTVSLRFGPEGTDPLSLASDVYAKYAAANPYGVTWTDRRPIASLHPSGSSPANRTGTNPRGWFNDPTINVNTQAGLATFESRLLQYAQQSVQIMLANNVQGAITWDIEGEQYAQPTTYIGDPRLATTLAPELSYDDVIDKYFATFTNAGLRVGVTIRPQQFVLNADGTASQVASSDELSLMEQKINYARQQWGATLFYIDSNDDYDGAIMQQLHAAEPGVLLIPEHQSTKTYQSTAPYDELAQGVYGTPQSVLDAYPQAFQVIYAVDADIDTPRATLVQSVKRGDILMIRGWWNDPYNAKVQSIYKSAYTPPGVPTGLAATMSGTSVSLAWNAVAGSAIVYNVKRSLVAGGPFTTLAYAVTGNSFVDATAATNQTYYYTVSAVNGYGESANATATKIMTTTLRTPDSPTNTVAGLNRSLYLGQWNALPNFSTLTPTTVDTVTNFAIGTGDYFAYVFTGYIKVPTSGVYTFFTTSDDGSDLYIGSTLVVNNDGLHGPTQKSGSIGLQAGLQALRVMMFNKTGGKMLEVRWQGPGVSEALVPAANLFRDATPVNQTIIDTTKTGGTITARGQNNTNGEGAAQAFDGNTATKWLDFPTAGPTWSSWLQYDYTGTTSYVLTSYAITSANDSPERDPYNWHLQGSNDGTNWATIDTETGVTFSSRFQKKTFTLNNTTPFQMIRLVIDQNDNPALTNLVQLSELQLFGYQA